MPEFDIDESLYEELTGAEKAAILLLSLEEELAAKIFQNFTSKEIHMLTGHATRLPNVDDEMLYEIRREFLQKVMGGSTVSFRQSRSRIKGILEKFLNEDQVGKYMEEMMAGEDLSEGFDAIRYVDAKTVAAFITDEHPQTIALIMAHLDAQKAAQVLPLLPSDMHSDIVTRIATLDRISPQVVKNIQEVFVHEIMASGAGKSRKVGGSEAVAELMNNIDNSTTQQIFNTLEETNPEFCEEIRSLMFVFTDLMSLDSRALQSIIKDVTNDVLTMALKTAPPELKDKIYNNISKRAAEMIAEELEVMGPVKLSDVEAAQQEIIGIARRLEEEGKITIAGKTVGDELV